MKDHEKRELVSELVGIARIAHGTEQLRDRIAYALSGVFSALDEATARAERAEAELKAAREQEPVAWRVRGQLFRFASDAILFRNMNTVCGGVVEKLYASPIPAPAAQVPQSCWLIERNAAGWPLIWLTLTTFERKYVTSGNHHYTESAQCALKFHDKESADEYIRHHQIKHVTATEHIFDARALLQEIKP